MVELIEGEDCEGGPAEESGDYVEGLVEALEAGED